MVGIGLGQELCGKMKTKFINHSQKHTFPFLSFVKFNGGELRFSFTLESDRITY